MKTNNSQDEVNRKELKSIFFTRALFEHPDTYNQRSKNNKRGLFVSQVPIDTSPRYHAGGHIPMVSRTITQAFGRSGCSKEELRSAELNLNVTGNLRRLTPKECFRLMGFLNDEINLEGLSDTQKYKLAGNGWDINLVSKLFKEMLKNE